MNQKEIENKKNELMQQKWTEDLHNSLREMDPRVAKKIVESMNESDIYVKVNHRLTQEDYIADYLGYLWEISKTAFWKHISISLDPSKGVLWAGDMPHFEILCNQKLPKDVLNQVLVLLITYESNSKETVDMDIEAIGCVLKAQIERFNQKNEIKDYIDSSNLSHKNEIFRRIEQITECNCNYNFY